MKSLRYMVPLGIFLVMSVFLYRGLSIDPKKIPSPYIDKPAPAFSLPTLQDADVMFGPEDMKGQVWILNVWATWCNACAAEHEMLNILAKRGGIKIVGLDWKDERQDALNWLANRGNPYVITVFDKKGGVAIDWGVYGAPESFVVDKKGIVRYKHVGPIGIEDARDTIIPMIKKLEAEA